MSGAPSQIADDGPARATLVTGFHGRGSLTLALDDVRDGLGRWRLWTRLGWNDIVHRYRRSLLGPLWLTVSMAILVVSLGLLYGEIFGLRAADFVPYLCAGMIIWGMINSVLTEAGELFTSSVTFLKQVRLPYSVYAYRFVWSRLIILAHNAVIFVILIGWFELWPGWRVLLAAPALALIVVNAVFAALTLGMLSARFRDIPQIVTSVVQLLFFLTPIMWKAEMLGPRASLVVYNPFYHMVEIVRAPLLGQWPPVLSIEAALLLTLINAAVALVLFARFRSRISYWI